MVRLKFGQMAGEYIPRAGPVRPSPQSRSFHKITNPAHSPALVAGTSKLLGLGRRSVASRKVRIKFVGVVLAGFEQSKTQQPEKPRVECGRRFGSAPPGFSFSKFFLSYHPSGPWPFFVSRNLASMPSWYCYLDIQPSKQTATQSSFVATPLIFLTLSAD